MGCFGSKAASGLCQMLLGLQPPHSTYVETHLGCGALMRRKAPAERSIGIDRDRRAIDGFECGYPVELVHGCAHDFLAGFPFRGTELVCSDPPYLRGTRRSRRRYRHDCTDADHVALLDPLKGLPCQVMVSGHPSALYDEALRDWRRIDLQVTTQGQVRTEVVWFNFAPDRMHRAGHAGRNRTDRQRIKRKAARWAEGCRRRGGDPHLYESSGLFFKDAWQGSGESSEVRSPVSGNVLGMAPAASVEETKAVESR